MYSILLLQGLYRSKHPVQDEIIDESYMVSNFIHGTPTSLFLLPFVSHLVTSFSTC